MFSLGTHNGLIVPLILKASQNKKHPAAGSLGRNREVVSINRVLR